MELKEAYHLGKVIKSYGKSGALVIVYNYPDADFINNLKFIFINIEGRMIPFYILECNAGDGYANMILEDINTPEKSQELLKKEVFVPKMEISVQENKKINIQLLRNFEVTDINKGSIGYVDSFLEGAEQTLLRIKKDNNEILIPFAEGIILEVNEQDNTIFIDAPEGLIELNET